MNFSLRCSSCRKDYTSQEALFNCRECGGSLDIVYDYEEIAKSFSEITVRKEKNMWKYRELLPVRETPNIVTLGEGGTELHQCTKLAKALKMKQLYAKNETTNPTGTYKDRSASVGISQVVEMSKDTIVIACDANSAPATAAYAAKAGLTCYVLMASIAPFERVLQTQVFGARVMVVQEDINRSMDIMAEISRKKGWPNLTTAKIFNPYQAEGPKTIAYEICEDLDWNVPDWVIIPIGGGSLLSGNWKGFKELYWIKQISKPPKIAGIQAKGCAPMVKAYREGKRPNEISPWQNPKTIAIAIGVPLPLDGPSCLTAIKESHGTAAVVSDEEILDSQMLLAKSEGIFAESAGAVSLAGLRKLLMNGIIDRKQTVVFEVTGTGLKDFKTVANLYKKPSPVQARTSTVEELIES